MSKKAAGRKRTVRRGNREAVKGNGAAAAPKSTGETGKGKKPARPNEGAKAFRSKSNAAAVIERMRRKNGATLARDHGGYALAGHTVRGFVSGTV